MNPQKYVINIRPGVGIPPTVNVSQGDIERPLLFTIMDGLTPLAIDSEHTTVTITGTKPSGLGYTITGDIDGSDVTFYTTEQMTQEPGFIRSELIVTGTGSTFRLGSANFDLVVEPTTHGTGVIDGTTEDARTVLERCEEYASDAAASAAEAASEAGAAATAGAAAGTAAAEAVVDDIEAEISDLKSDLTQITGNTVIDLVPEKFVKLSGTTVGMADGHPVYTNAQTAYSCGIVPCVAGDIFTINGHGGSDTRLWGFVDSEGTILSVSDANFTATEMIITAPTNSAFLIVHTNDGRMSVCGELLTKQLKPLSSMVSDLYPKDSSIVWERLTGTAGGTFSSGNGATSQIITNIKNIDVKMGAKAALFLYDADATYLGKINSSYGMDQASGSWGFYTGSVDIDEILKKFNADGVRISLVPTDSTSITTANVATYGANHCDIFDTVQFATHAEIDSDLYDTKETLWRKGAQAANGVLDKTVNSVTSSILPINSIKDIILSSNIKVALFLYRNGAYMGKINASNGVDKAAGSWKYFYERIDSASIKNSYSSVEFDGIVLGVLPVDGTTITAETAQTYGESHCDIRYFKFASANDIEARPSQSFILSINHRGYSIEAPENTLPAFVMSGKMGFKAIEADLAFTSDNVPVMLHDNTINNTARNADGTTISTSTRIDSITYDQALTYDFGIWKNEKYAGTKIPTFSEVLLVAKQLGLDVWLDIKVSFTDAQATLIANAVKAAGMDEHVIYMCSSTSTLTKMSAIFPKATLLTGLSTYTTAGVQSVISAIESLRNGNNLVLTSYYHVNMTNELYALFSDAGIQGIAWTNVGARIEPPLDKNVYGVFTDMQNFGKEIADILYKTYL